MQQFDWTSKGHPNKTRFDVTLDLYAQPIRKVEAI